MQYLQNVAEENMPATILEKLFLICLTCTSVSAGAPGIDTLAVVPFQVIGDSANAEIYEYGLPEAIANDLASIPGLTVVERLRLSSVLQEFKLAQAGFVSEQNAPRIGELLAARVVLTGTVHKSESAVHVFVRAVSVASGEVLFSVKAEQNGAKLIDLFKLEDLLARKVAVQLGLAMAQDEIAKIDTAPTFSEDAFQLYSAGLKSLDGGDFPTALSKLKRSAEIDSHFNWAQKVRIRAQKAFEELEKETKK